MVCSAVFITNMKGKIIISRNFRGDVPMGVADHFQKYLVASEPDSMVPVFHDGEYSFLYVQHANVYLMAVTRQNSNAALVLSFLYRLIDVFEEYFNELHEETIRDNFVLIYELLDEMMDFGFPQSTEAKILKDYICVQERHQADIRPPDAVTNAVGWRPPNLKYKDNEVFLDVVEKLNMLISPEEEVLHSEILGTLKLKTRLTGMPELKLGLNDRLFMEQKGRARPRGGAAARGKMVDLDDIRFHQCVRLARFETDRTISFIPPDGEFELMTYRLDTTVRPLISVKTQVEKGRSRIELFVKVKSEFKRRSSANNVEIEIPVPPDAASPAFRNALGDVEYKPERDAIVWTIKHFRGQKECLLRAQFALPSVSAGEEEQVGKKPVRVKFEIPYFTVSGIQVRYLKIIEKSGYEAHPWVRYITENGDYQIRMKG